MRLTLRTMLAYMDDILEPSDHQQVGQKIEESEFATNLLHKIRDVTRRMRLGAPKVSGRGMGLDPNTVAEYLDNTLAGERVPDFEKVCLESDVHLAEVASCHQILTLVLGEPAEVDPSLRRRMYEIISESAPAEARASASAGAAATAVGAAAIGAPASGLASDATPTPGKTRPEVPEYLRGGSRSRFWPIALGTIVVICLLVFAVVRVLGPLDGTNPAIRWISGNPQGPEVVQNTPQHAPENADGKTSPNKTSNDAGKTQEVDAKAQTGDGNGTQGQKGSGALSAVDKVDQGSDKSANDKTGNKGPLGTTTNPVAAGPSTTLGQPAAIVAPPPPDLTQGPVPPSPSKIVSAPPAGGPPPVAPAPPAGTPANVLPPGTPVVATETPLPRNFDAASPPGNERLGRLISDQEVLLRLDAGNGEWQRVASGVAFRTGDKLLALPTFRPTITLSAGVTLQLLPETLLDLQGSDAQGNPVVRIEYGRVKMMTAGKPDVRLRVNLARAGGLLTFDDAEASGAAEVRPYQLPGIDPEANPPRIGSALYVLSGQLQWQGESGESRTLSATGGRLKSPPSLIISPFPPETAADHDVPKWLGAETVNPLDVRAAQSLNQALDGKHAVSVVLREMAEHRRAENRSLAARSLALVNDFDPFVDLLNDVDQRAVWTAQIESLQAALDRGPAVALKIRTTFERQLGKDGDELYRMLWGYSKDDLVNGAAKRLVDLLDHDTLAFRVLAFHNLRMITGATFNYRPEATAANRQPATRRWQEQLKDGLIVPKGSVPTKPAIGETTPGAELPAAGPSTTAPPAAPVPVVPPPPSPDQ